MAQTTSLGLSLRLWARQRTLELATAPLARRTPLNTHSAPLLARLEQKQALVGIVGLGYVGLPLVQAFVDAGFRVLGFDVDRKKIDSLCAGESYIRHIPGEWIATAMAAGKFAATADMHRLGEPDAILILSLIHI